MHHATTNVIPAFSFEYATHLMLYRDWMTECNAKYGQCVFFPFVFFKSLVDSVQL